MANKIGWCDMTINYVWGCNKGCSYCYARDMAYRLSYNKKLMNYFKKVQPDLNIQNLRDFKPTWIESNYSKKFPKKPKRIFMDSMSDINFWKWAWVDAMFEKIRKYPQHTLQLLTKFPEVYQKYSWPDNCWLGITITCLDDLIRMKDNLPKTGKIFVSLEPILDDAILTVVPLFDWIILGLKTGRKNVFIPNKHLVSNLVGACRSQNIPVFMKNSMKKVWPDELIQEFPK